MSESVPRAIGMRTRESLARIAVSVSPGPSAPTSIATFCSAMCSIASARVCAAVPATVTGDMAPARMKGVTITAWLARE